MDTDFKRELLFEKRRWEPLKAILHYMLNLEYIVRCIVKKDQITQRLVSSSYFIEFLQS